VGPHSAGADPGPAALGRGNREPTITDAHIVLGRLNPKRYLDGGVTLQPDLAESAIAGLAAKLGMSEAEAASGILRIGNANMTAATRLISVQRGYDPREFALVAGGGAGPLHAVDIARELGIPVVVVPPTPGVTSAVGILQVDLRHDIMRSVLSQTHYIDPVDLGRVFKELQDEAAEILNGEQIPPDRRRIELSIDVRYYGQTPYLNLLLDEVPESRSAIDRIAEAYAEQYEREFGYRLDADIATVEIVNARAAAVGMSDPAEFVLTTPEGQDAAPAHIRAVYFDEIACFTDTPIYDRAQLPAGVSIDGPAIVEQMDTTVLIPPGARAKVDDRFNLVIDVESRRQESAALAAAGPIDRGA
jgi:N-methylhydantoinase A